MDVDEKWNRIHSIDAVSASRQVSVFWCFERLRTLRAPQSVISARWIHSYKFRNRLPENEIELVTFDKKFTTSHRNLHGIGKLLNRHVDDDTCADESNTVGR